MDKLLHHVGPHIIRHVGEHIFKALNKPTPPNNSKSAADHDREFAEWEATLHGTRHTEPTGWLANQRGWDMIIMMEGYVVASGNYCQQWWLVSIDPNTVSITAREINDEMTSKESKAMYEWLKQHTCYATHYCKPSEAKDIYCHPRDMAVTMKLAQMVAVISLQLQATSFTLENVEGEKKARYVLKRYKRNRSGGNALRPWIGQSEGPIPIKTLGRELDYITPEIEFVGWSMTNADLS
jgi:hypothetical protein